MPKVVEKFLGALLVLYLFASKSAFAASADASNEDELVQELNVALNSTVLVKCNETGGPGTGIYFLVNGIVIDTSIDMFTKRRIIQGNQQTVNGSVERSLSVEAQEINNNTNISCYIVPSGITKTICILKIQGLLASVGDLTDTFINGSSVLLSWTPPYTLDNVPITGYYIDDGFRNYTTNGTSIVLSSANPDPCTSVNVSVSAINEVGNGELAFISFYYKKVPPKASAVSIIPLVINQSLSLNVTINASKLCNGEYPSNITFCVLETNGTVVYSNSISPEINEQLRVITGHISLILPDTPTVIINVSLSNKGGEFNDVSSFALGIPGPITNITLANSTCNTITVTWDSPMCTYILCDVLYYKLNINDNSLIARNTYYEYKDNNVDHHRFNISITGVNELGPGIDTNATCYYYKVPRPALNDTTTLNVSNGTVLYNILVSVVCIGEAPENATITLMCNETGFVDNDTIPATPGNITGSFPLPQDQTCHLTIVFSNDAGDSEPLIKPIRRNTPQDPSNVPMNEIPWWKIGTGSAGVIGFIMIISSVISVVLYTACRKSDSRSNMS